MDSFIDHTIAAVRHQLKALDQSLEMLEKQLRKPAEDDGKPTCPFCGSKDMIAMHMMGSQTQYACSGCSFSGAL